MPTTRSMTKIVNPIDTIRQHMALNLIIPPGLGVGQQWFPHRYEPSIVLTKTIPVEPTKLPEPAPILNKAQAVDAPAVVLTSYIGHDTVFACYHATFERTRGVADEAGDDEPVLVAKLVDLSHFPKVDATHVAGIIARDFESWTSLKDVQGGPVPRFAGLFTHGTLCCQVFEDAGRAISYEEKQQKSVRAEIFETFKELFRAGAIPPSVVWRIIRRGNDGRIKITDLGSSLAEFRDGTVPEWNGLSPEKLYAAHCEEAVIGLTQHLSLSCRGASREEFNQMREEDLQLPF